MTNQDGIGVRVEYDNKGGPYFSGFLDSIHEYHKWIVWGKKNDNTKEND